MQFQNIAIPKGSLRPMYRRLAPPSRPIRFTFEGHVVEAETGDTVAAALLTAGLGPFRETPGNGAPRAAFCMMGICFDCLVSIDGEPNRQACLVEARDGMVVARQRGAA